MTLTILPVTQTVQEAAGAGRPGDVAARRSPHDLFLFILRFAQLSEALQINVR